MNRGEKTFTFFSTQIYKIFIETTALSRKHTSFGHYTYKNQKPGTESLEKKTSAFCN